MAARRQKKNPLLRRWLLRGIAVLSIFVACSLLLVLPLRWFDPVATAFMLQDERPRHALRHEWTDLESLGIAPVLAVVAAEDQRFAAHFGFDFESIRKAVEGSREGRPLRGASTLTQQVAKNLYLWPGRSFLRKGLEAWFTLLIEICWPKHRIVEVYLNIAELGPGTWGVPAASRYYFGKAPHRLTDAEAALLAAVLPNPKALHVDRPSDYVRERQRWILGQMQRLRREQWIMRID